jgi:hypothetical protein
VIRDVIEKHSPRVVLAEGLLLSEDVKHTVSLGDVRVIFLTTSTDQCLIQVKSRRLEVGDTRPLDSEKANGNPTAQQRLVRRDQTIERARVRLLEEGIICRRLSANQAVGIVQGWLDHQLGTHGEIEEEMRNVRSHSK